MREKINLNEDWFFSTEFNDSMLDKDFSCEKLTKVRLPHSVAETPFNYFDESIYQMISCYRRELYVQPEWEGRRLILTFEGAAHRAEIFVNGRELFTHENGYTAFSVDIGKYVNYDQVNNIVVKLDSRETINQPPFGLVIDYMTYGGLYREVYLEVVDSVYIEDVFVWTEKVLDWNILSEIKIDGAEVKGNYSIGQKIFAADDSKKMILEITQQELILNNKSTVKIKSPASGIFEWSIDSPRLYNIESILYYKKEPIDSVLVRFGFREAIFRSDGFYLNGEKIKIRGLNRHQSYPYVGYAMPAGVQAEDADILKNELALNAVRTSHYPQSQHFIDRCDELGLLVFTEIPGWQHIGDSDWQNIACKNTEEMVSQYRNHPSIILWGVRINESSDNDQFYTETNNIAHELDPSRQTSGVRFLERSSLLEDVYSFNDFSHVGGNDGTLQKKRVSPDKKKGYLISEYNGHMFPVKSMDTERIRTEHAIRHANVIASYYKKDDIAGGFGWCMFDYNTHRDFGSGDRICYHGVLDSFRNHKVTAAVYASQRDAHNSEDIFAEVTSNMEIGEHPGGNIENIYAFTNADSVKLYKNNDFAKEFYPAKGKYDAMPHPPIIIDDIVGSLMETKEGFKRKKSEAIKKMFIIIRRYGHSGLPLRYRLQILYFMLRYKITSKEGYRLYSDYIANWGGLVNSFRFDFILKGKAVKRIDISPMTKTRLVVKTMKTLLVEGDTYDATLVRFRMENEHGRILPFCNDIVSLEVSDNLEIIGPKQIALRGGLGGSWIKTKKQDAVGAGTGKAFLQVSSGKHRELIRFQVKQT